VKKILIGLTVGLILFGSCSAQNALAQSTNDAQRIVGTWKTEGVDVLGVVDVVFTFNANGTFTLSGANVVPIAEGNYLVVNSKLLLRSGEHDTAFFIDDYYLSADGMTLVFQYTFTRYDSINQAYRSGGYLWLIKQ
jgi:hypothetical protein